MEAGTAVVVTQFAGAKADWNGVRGNSSTPFLGARRFLRVFGTELIRNSFIATSPTFRAEVTLSLLENFGASSLSHSGTAQFTPSPGEELRQHAEDR
jgi:hypothetical protein